MTLEELREGVELAGSGGRMPPMQRRATGPDEREDPTDEGRPGGTGGG